MQISVVIPTVDRKMRLLSLLASLDRSTYPIHEVIIVDAGNDRLAPNEYSAIKNFPVYYIPSERSVCIQRNTGIRLAKAEWIFLCDDDIEVPTDYLAKITGHILKNPQAGAVSGLVLQKEKDEWRSEYPEKTFGSLFWKYIFKLSIWGSIQCKGNNFLLKKIKKYYLQKENHISKAGWPVLTDFSGDYFVAPVFGLGASVVKKDWLQNSPYDEVLDSHGIGDHYGVAAGFPATGIHILNDAFVYHHQETTNRLSKAVQYYRRVLALDYFIKTGKKNKMTKRRWLFWSLCGNKVSFLFAANLQMIWANLKAMFIILSGQNPYYIAAKNKTKITEPKL